MDFAFTDEQELLRDTSRDVLSRTRHYRDAVQAGYDAPDGPERLLPTVALVSRLPLAGRTAKGKAMVNILPIGPGISIAALMPVDAPEEDWDNLQIVFATSDGDVRQNDLSDFTNVKRNGKIAMNLPEGVFLVNAAIADENDDVMLVTAGGRAIRFPTTDIRVFKSRGSTGVRGIRLAEGDSVVSMAIIRHFEATPEEREAYLKQRRLMAGAVEDEVDLIGGGDRDGGGGVGGGSRAGAG